VPANIKLLIFCLMRRAHCKYTESLMTLSCRSCLPETRIACGRIRAMSLKPRRLRPGDTVAAVSLSQDLAPEVPHRYAVGKQPIEQTFGVKVIETPNALRDNDWLYRNPKARAEDFHWALRRSSYRPHGREKNRCAKHLGQ
jgi:hypothetical protein